MNIQTYSSGNQLRLPLPVDRIYLTLPLPVEQPWYQFFVSSLKQYGNGCDLYIALSGIFEDIVNPVGESSDNLGYMFDQLYTTLADSLQQLPITKYEVDTTLDNFTYQIEDVIYSFKIFYRPYLSSVDLSDLNETGYITVRIAGINQSFIIVELEGAKYATYPVPDYTNSF